MGVVPLQLRFWIFIEDADVQRYALFQSDLSFTHALFIHLLTFISNPPPSPSSLMVHPYTLELPMEEPAFLDLLHTYFPFIYDVKYMMTSVEGMYGGLSALAGIHTINLLMINVHRYTLLILPLHHCNTPLQHILLQIRYKWIELVLCIKPAVIAY